MWWGHPIRSGVFKSHKALRALLDLARPRPKLSPHKIPYLLRWKRNSKDLSFTGLQSKSPFETLAHYFNLKCARKYFSWLNKDRGAKLICCANGIPVEFTGYRSMCVHTKSWRLHKRCYYQPFRRLKQVQTRIKTVKKL